VSEVQRATCIAVANYCRLPCQESNCLVYAGCWAAHQRQGCNVFFKIALLIRVEKDARSRCTRCNIQVVIHYVVYTHCVHLSVRGY
jgi:hypothetical protein